MGLTSAEELREVLDEVMREIDADPEDGARLGSAAGPLRIEFTDLKLVLNLSAATSGRHCVSWDFKQRSKARPVLKLAMDSEFGNRLLQGRENPVIAIARGNLQTTVNDAGTALRFFPAAKPLFVHYREVVAERYPHLALD